MVHCIVSLMFFLLDEHFQKFFIITGAYAMIIYQVLYLYASLLFLIVVFSLTIPYT